MSELAAWLREQLDEDSRLARLTEPVDDERYDDEPWKYDKDRDAWRQQLHTLDCGYHMLEMESACRCDYPARLLIDLDVKRRILDRHAPRLDGREKNRVCAECGGAEWKPELGVLQAFPWVMPWPCPTLRLLALPYDDRPGYREEWRP